jgi:hypothetical protein
MLLYDSFKTTTARNRTASARPRWVEFFTFVWLLGFVETRPRFARFAADLTMGAFIVVVWTMNLLLAIVLLHRGDDGDPHASGAWHELRIENFTFIYVLLFRKFEFRTKQLAGDINAETKLA